MGTFSAWHWILVAIVVLLLFGRGKISEFMGDAAKGIKAFKKGLAEEDKPETPTVVPASTIDHQPPVTPAAPPPVVTPTPAPAATTSDQTPASAPKVG
ncbi:twin-arginine translocase TatA/TatE family subunit [Phreatobacter cathodiphilus]|uniref:Sec-independent protein translocase protein TatA n=1 Tax=Phreatobacter cathodiphilus TaxID=1868589 RepID=A0A2S0NAB9_9HYPH|nr:twin-arginine translocase TatA/TatE family subunit [Phreatobacter cathodiphilus]AVO45046.1 twin-arginine translocase TatA/TatE family subunit [Phreatobacter cathodiphilus]